jgi:hypothetical protein
MLPCLIGVWHVDRPPDWEFTSHEPYVTLVDLSYEIKIRSGFGSRSSTQTDSVNKQALIIQIYDPWHENRLIRIDADSKEGKSKYKIRWQREIPGQESRSADTRKQSRRPRKISERDTKQIVVTALKEIPSQGQLTPRRRASWHLRPRPPHAVSGKGLPQAPAWRAPPCGARVRQRPDWQSRRPP